MKGSVESEEKKKFFSSIPPQLDQPVTLEKEEYMLFEPD